MEKAVDRWGVNHLGSVRVDPIIVGIIGERLLNGVNRSPNIGFGHAGYVDMHAVLLFANSREAAQMQARR